MPADPFIGEVILFAGTFAPRGWAFCHGQLLPIAQNSALFSIVGTIYGGDGRTTFGLPDLRGRVPLGSGNGPGLANYNLGSKGGSENVTLTVNQIPSHTHNLRGQDNTGTQSTPGGGTLAASAAEDASYRNDATTMADMHANSIANTGGNRPHPNMQPYLAMNYIIALVGLYPSRS